MSYDLKAIRAGLAAALQPLVDAGQLTASSPYGLPNPMTPCAMVTTGPTTFDEAMGGGLDGLTLMVAVVVGLASEVDAQVALDALLARGPMSVKALLEADPTLGGACQDLRVTEASGQRVYALDTVQGSTTAPVLGCEWTVEVMA